MQHSASNSDKECGRLTSLSRALETRSRARLAVHRFFHGRGYLEVETPVRLNAPALETHIDAEPSGGMFLRTSPELHMKRMLAAGYEKIYQIGPCFRKGERGDRHHPEYTMLEWYGTGMSYLDIMQETKALLTELAPLALPACRIDLTGDWNVIPVSEAFATWAGWDPAGAFDAARFDIDLVEKVEPALPRDVPVALIDYPAEAAAFSRLKPDDPLRAERWELYLGGMEIANAYTELTDAAEQRKRFETSAEERKAMGKPVYPIDRDFMDAMERGLPECAGIALGIDRLVMVLCGAASIADVTAFRENES